MALDMAREEGLIDIRGLVEGLRSRRPKMVQTIQQYEWLHDAALEAVLCGDTCVYGMDLTNHYDHLITFDPVCGQAPIVEEFETLVIMTPKLNINQHCTTSQMVKNKPKNRFADVLPADCHLPRLHKEVVNNINTNSMNRNKTNHAAVNSPNAAKIALGLQNNNTNDDSYINATLCDSYKRPSELIITQTPLPDTVIDFWRLVWDFAVYSIVMVDDLGEHDESCQIYWPRGSVKNNNNSHPNTGRTGRNQTSSGTSNGMDDSLDSQNTNSGCHDDSNKLHPFVNGMSSERADTPLSSCTSNTNASETVVRFGNFEIELLSKDDEIDLAVRTFKVTKILNTNHNQHSSNNIQSPNHTLDSHHSHHNSINSRHNKNSESRIIKHFQLLAWPPKNSVPTSRNSTLRIISLIQKWRNQVAHVTQQTVSPIDGPETASPRMLMHCIAGAGRSGTFSCCYNVVEQLIAEKSADIFSQALKLRSHRPQLIESLDQYRFVYEVAGTFVDDTFDNTNTNNSKS